MNRLEQLGRDVARMQDEARTNRPGNEQAAQSFIRALRRSRPRARPRWQLLLVAAVAALVPLAAVWVLHGRAGHPTASAVEVGQSLVATSGQSRPVAFPDGSGAILTPGAEVVVRELTESGAQVDVASGEVSFAVHHRDNTKWLVGAGPFRVHVTGTRFAVTWAPDRERFSLRLSEGSVVVSIENASHGDVKLAAPASLVVERGQWQSDTPASVASVLPPSASPEVSAAPTSSAAEGNEPVDDRGAALSPTHAAPKSWQDLSRSGDYAAAYESASKRGITSLTETAASSSLLTLAEVCRFSGHAGEAAQILTRLRQRFPGTDDAATAAFELGRDGGGASWFRAYLAERPNGALALEASGRLLEALSRSGDRAAAHDAARAYLSRYPNGPHAAFARQLLGS
jgi:transmembrane sensor